MGARNVTRLQIYVAKDRYMSAKLAKPVADFINATNSFDLAAFLASFADDALVNDRHRQFGARMPFAHGAKKRLSAIK
ncbi:MAG: hypothetical protein JJE34_08165 [Alphaproteobacteria bacterium]|nr:hypothetical protein [Alphaproteobacteria bacterium]